MWKPLINIKTCNTLKYLFSNLLVYDYYYYYFPVYNGTP